MFHHSGDNVLEPYGDFIAFLVQDVREPVEQVVRDFMEILG